MSILGLVQCKIQHGVGSGSIVINEVDANKTLVFVSSVAVGDGALAVHHATLVDATHINCSTTLAWWVVELGGAVSE